MELRPLRKKGAIELGVGTMVIIVIAVVLLILALVFIRRIFTGATHNVDQLNDAVRNQINKVFGQEGQKVALYLPGNTAKIRQGETFGIAFGIKNIDPGAGTFHYEISVDDVAPSNICPGIAESHANSWILLGKTGDIPVASGDIGFGLVKINVPSSAPVGCQIRYRGTVTTAGSGTVYTSFFFDVEVNAKGIAGLF